MFARTRFLLASLLLLSACASTESLETLRAMTPSGDAYQVALANNYKALAEEQLASYEYSLSKYFAVKGLDAANSKVIEPEDPKAWEIKDPALAELSEVRERLMKAVSTNRSTQPELSAAAMMAYDRWLILSRDESDAEAAKAQKDALMELLPKLEEVHTPSESAPPPPPSVPSESKRSVLYFPFDSAKLNDATVKEIKQLIETIDKEAAKPITINGHADRKGPAEYNMRLSERRAISVLKALEKAGIAAKRLQHYAFGETDPAVATADEVEEPKNRRVEIMVEQ